MTQFTSFVAVEEVTVREGGQPRRIEVPVEMPEGVSYEGVFGERGRQQAMAVGASAPVAYKSSGGFLPQVLSRRKETVMAVPPPGATSQAVEVRPAPTPLPRQDSPREADVRDAVSSKMHTDLQAVVARLRNPALKASAAEARFVRNGKAEVQVFLTDNSPAAIAVLQQMGFEVVVQSKASKVVVGRIAVEKLAELARLSIVTYVAPQLNTR
jgi:Ca-activated chloride channel family protein